MGQGLRPSIRKLLGVPNMPLNLSHGAPVSSAKGASRTRPCGNVWGEGLEQLLDLWSTLPGGQEELSHQFK